MNAILFFLGGVIIGVFITTLCLVKEPVGTLKVDNSDPDSPPYLFLEMDHGMASKLLIDKQVMLRVDISQK